MLVLGLGLGLGVGDDTDVRVSLLAMTLMLGLVYRCSQCDCNVGGWKGFTAKRLSRQRVPRKGFKFLGVNFFNDIVHTQNAVAANSGRLIGKMRLNCWK